LLKKQFLCGDIKNFIRLNAKVKKIHA